MTDQYAVIGNPIEHSKSPLIHQAFAQQTGQDMHYVRVLAPLDGFAQKVEELIAMGYKGANVTVPFKGEAFRLPSNIIPKPQVLLAGAVNTLTFTKEGILKDNTDGVGLVRDIEQNLHTSIQGKRVLLIGAGGAAEGVAHPIADKAPALFVAANRSLEKAVAIVSKLASVEEYVHTTFYASTLEGLQNQAFDIVINATSTGLSNTALPIPHSVFASHSLAYDMMYGRETPFMAQARNAGAMVSDGLGMLVEQAAEAFYLWRGVRPETQAVMTLLRNPH
jgi:shikimate dehydrogenase